MRVFEFGEVPPPYGGVTVHLQRLIERLADDGFAITLVAEQPPLSIRCPISYLPWPAWPRYVNHLEFLRGLTGPFRGVLLHLHTNPVFRAPLVLLHVLRGWPALITVHDQMIGDRLAHGLFYERLCFRLLLRSAQVRWIAVSEPIQKFLIDNGARPGRVRVVPAYLGEQQSDPKGALAESILEFAAQHAPVLVVYGYNRDFLAGQDLYGFDFALEVLCELRSTHPGAGLIVLCPAGAKDANGWRPLQNRARSEGLSEDVLFHLQPVQTPLELWRRCDVMIRPTLTDGDSVAVREMIALGRPVIASDAAPRPVAVHVLPLGSAPAWADAIVDSLGTPSSPLHEYPPVPADGYAEIKAAILSCVGDVG